MCICVGVPEEIPLELLPFIVSNLNFCKIPNHTLIKNLSFLGTVPFSLGNHINCIINAYSMFKLFLK